jgi:hypothetical protein
MRADSSILLVQLCSRWCPGSIIGAVTGQTSDARTAEGPMPELKSGEGNMCRPVLDLMRAQQYPHPHVT